MPLRNVTLLLFVLVLIPATTYAQPFGHTGPEPLDITTAERILPHSLQQVGDALYYRTDSGLWRTDGTPAGTIRIFPDPAVSQIVPFGSGFVFVGTNATSGTELWQSDGSVNGTTLLVDLDPGAGSSFPSLPVVLGNKLIFVTHGYNKASTLWVSDGSAAGTQQLLSIPPASLSTTSITVWSDIVGNQLFFSITQSHITSGGQLKMHLWRTDGTAQGTIMLRENIAAPAQLSAEAALAPLPLGFLSMSITPVQALQSKIAFTAVNSLGLRELWASDGTPAGTMRIHPGITLWPVALLNPDTMLFCVEDATGRKAWRSDGTRAGSFSLPAACPSFGTGVIPNGLFTSQEDRDRAIPAALWHTDGTVAGTAKVHQFPYHPNYVYAPRAVRAVHGRYYFQFEYFTPQGGSDIWQTDGTAAGTHPAGFPPFFELEQLQPSSDAVLLRSAVIATDRRYLFVSNGTAASLRQIAGLGYSWQGELVPYKGNLAAVIRDNFGDSIKLLLADPALTIKLPVVTPTVAAGVAMLPVAYGTNGAAAQGIDITLALPAGATYLDDSSGVAPIVQGSTVRWAAADLALLTHRNFTVRLQLADGALGSRETVQVRISSSGANPGEANATTDLLRASNSYLPQISGPASQ
jgi:ELWxxDGT repeat protein